MKDHALASLIRTILGMKTKGEAVAYAQNVGADYADLINALVARLTWSRTKKQNNFVHGWFSEVGNQMGEEPIEVKRRAKLDIGCIILCRDEPGFLENCKRTMGHLDREDRLLAMDYLHVTSIMSTKQLSEFADTFERLHRAQGFTLTNPDKEAA